MFKKEYYLFISILLVLIGVFFSFFLPIFNWFSFTVKISGHEEGYNAFGGSIINGEISSSLISKIELGVIPAILIIIGVIFSLFRTRKDIITGGIVCIGGLILYVVFCVLIPYELFSFSLAEGQLFGDTAEYVWGLRAGFFITMIGVILLLISGIISDKK